MKKLKIILAVLLVAVSGYAVTNLVVTLTFSDAQFQSLNSIATNQGLTVSNYLVQTNLGIAQTFRDADDQARLRLLITLWQSADDTKRSNALSALR